MPKNARLDLINAIENYHGTLDPIIELLYYGRSSTGIWGSMSKKGVLPFAELNGSTPFHLLAQKGILSSVLKYIQAQLTNNPAFVKREFYENREEDKDYQKQITEEAGLTARQLNLTEEQAKQFLTKCLNKKNKKEKTVLDLCKEVDKQALIADFPGATQTEITAKNIIVNHNDQENQLPNIIRDKDVPKLKVTHLNKANFESIKTQLIKIKGTDISKSLGSDYTTLELFIWAYTQYKKFADLIPSNFTDKDDFMGKLIATQTEQDFAHINSKKSLNAFGLTCYYGNATLASKLLGAENFKQGQQISIKKAIEYKSIEIIETITAHYGEETDWQTILFSSIKNGRHEILDYILSMHQYNNEKIVISGRRGEEVEYNPQNYLLHILRKEASKNVKTQLSKLDEKDKIKSQERLDIKTSEFMKSIEKMQEYGFNFDPDKDLKTNSLIHKLLHLIDNMKTDETGSKFAILQPIIGERSTDSNIDNFSIATGGDTFGTGTASIMLLGKDDEGSGLEDNF